MDLRDMIGLGVIVFIILFGPGIMRAWKAHAELPAGEATGSGESKSMV